MGRPGSTYYMGKTGENLRAAALEAAEKRQAAGASLQEAKLVEREAARRAAAQAQQNAEARAHQRRESDRIKLRQREQARAQQCRDTTAAAWAGKSSQS